MHQSELDATRDDLVAWGVLATPSTFTRRFQAAMARAAAQLREAGGQERGSAAILATVKLALTDFLPHDATGQRGVASDLHRRYVAGVHIASLPPAVRDVLGV